MICFNFSFNINFYLIKINILQGVFNYINSVYLLQLNFSLLVISLLIGGISAYTFEFSPVRSFFKTNILLNFLRPYIVGTLLISFFLFLLNIFFFFNYLITYTNSSVLFDNIYSLNYYSFYFTQKLTLSISFFNFSLDLFGIILLFLSYIVGFLSLLALDSRLY